MKFKADLISEFSPMDGSVLFSSSLGNILVGCPPEILKVLLKKHLSMPDTIVIPGTLHKYSSSQVCLEFPFYHFLFVQQGLARGKKLKVFAKQSICRKLSEMLRVTLLGPGLDQVLKAERRLLLPQKINQKKIGQIRKEAEYLALKAENGRVLPIDKMIEFRPLEVNDEQVVYESFQNHPAIRIKRPGEDNFIIQCDREYKATIRIASPQSPAYTIKAKKVTPHELKSKTVFNIRCLGASEGFDPSQPANGLLIRLHGKWILWDCPPYLNLHLKKIGLEKQDIDVMFISHVHEDHIDVMQTIRQGSRTDVYTTTDIFHCMVLKLMAVLDCSYEEAVNHYNLIPIYADRPFELFKATFEVFYSVHSIPALGLKLTVPYDGGISKLFISGDTLPKRMINQLDQSNVFSTERKKEIDSILPDDSDFTLALVDAGRGIIHGDPEDYFEKKTKVFYMHTGKPITNIPHHHHLLSSGERIIIHR